MTREEAKAYIIRHCNPDYPKGETEWEQAVNMAIKALQQPEQRWIPCSERPPEKNGDYLVTGRKGAVDKRKYEDGRWYGGWAVLAYMPLPEPYREEGEE